MNDPRTTVEKSCHAQCKHIICGKGFHHLKGDEEKMKRINLPSQWMMDQQI